ncbi:uncharacterized protein LOC116415422, partial [Apis florea]|uniref:uncharacterized protein LOC116415422 n=1 Tax=Apis florea TaxID=7463 RepID=UPI0012FF1376
DQVPPAVGQSFSVLLPSLITLSIFGITAAILAAFNVDLVTLISRLIQEPLRKVNTSLPGFLLIYSTGNFLYTLGIHQTVINGSLLDPLNLVNMNENTAAVSAGRPATHIINTDFVTVYSQMGGTGLTIALIIAVLLVSHYQPYKDVVKLAIVPGIFEINEPIIFGFPIVFNIPMIIPFVLSPVIGSLIGYFATAIGFVKPIAYMVPWTTPPILSGILSSGGDWKWFYLMAGIASKGFADLVNTMKLLMKKGVKFLGISAAVTLFSIATGALATAVVDASSNTEQKQEGKTDKQASRDWLRP